MNDRYNRYFSTITPHGSNEEFLTGVLRKAENMDTEKKRISFKKPLAVVGAAAAVLTAGVTAGAAAGLIDFNAIFGGNITADNEILGESLVSEMSDFRYEVSEEDYIIVPKGMTGTSKSMCVSFDIERADGKPVSDFFLTTADTNELASNLVCSAPRLIEDRESFSSGLDDISISVNEDGNISVTLMMTYSMDIAGETIRIIGSDLYEVEELILFREQQDVFDHFIDEAGTCISAYETEGLVYDSDFFRDNERADVDESGLILHELDWGIEFVYTPTETATESVHAKDLTENYFVSAIVHETQKTTTLEVDATDIEAGSTMLYISYKYADSAVSEDGMDNKMMINDPEVTVQLADGRNISAHFEFGTGEKLSDGTWADCMAMYYTDGKDKLALDVKDIVSVTVNGVVYHIG